MKTPLNEITCLVLEGGGLKGAAYIQFFRTIEKYNPDFIKNIEKYAGSSAGALVVACMAMQKDMNEIEHILDALSKLNIKDYNSHCCCVPNMLKPFYAMRNVMSGYGAFSTRKFETFLRKTFKFNGKDVLFRDLNKQLVITAVNLNTHNMIFFSNELTPDVPLYKAVMSSACIPFIFQPLRYDFNPGYKLKNHLLIDGGNMMNLPIKVFDEANPYDGIVSQRTNPNVMGVRLDSPEDLQFINGTVNESIDNGMAFIGEFLDTTSYNCKMNIRDDDRTCSIIVKRYKLDDLTMTRTKKIDLFRAGEDAAMNLMNKDRNKKSH